MKVTVLGFRRVDFVDDRSGREFAGITLFTSFKDADVTGEMVERFYIADNLGLDFSNVVPGTQLDLEFNRRGKVVDFTFAE